VLFHAQKPRESWIRSDATMHQTYDPKRRRAQRLHFKSNAAAKAILSGFFGDFDALEEVFELAEWSASSEQRLVRLIPRRAELEEHLQDLRLVFEPNRVALRSVGYTSARGDTVAIEFKSVELDPELESAAQLFDPALPKDVTVDERRVGGRR
jgi:outer membrane lipoprotein-sorting protein